MTMPTKKLPFGFTSCRDMLGKLGREISRLETAKTLEDAADYGTNAAVVAWHLTDWIWFAFGRNPTLKARVMDEAQQEWEKRPAFQDWLRKESAQLSICKKITNSFKHSIELEEDITVPERIEGQWVNAAGEVGPWVNAKGETGGWRAKGTQWFIVVGDEEYLAIELFQEVHKFWNSFLDRYGIQ